MLIKRYKELDSTNEELKRLYKADGLTPLAVAAEAQSGGKGRNRRFWASPRNKGIYLSYGNLAGSIQGLAFRLMLISSLSAFDTIRSLINCNDIRIKWPNDILIESKKVCGILNEGIPVENDVLYIMGIGINIYYDESCKDIENYTCLERYSDRKIAVEDALSLLLENIESYDKKTGLQEMTEMYRNLLYRPDHDIQIIKPFCDEPVTGRILDISNDGTLYVRSGNSTISLKSAEILITAPSF